MKRLLDLSARMAVCDANYLRLLKLLPEFGIGQSRLILLPSLSATQQQAMHRLEITVTESFRYTSTVQLSLIVEEEKPDWFLSPRMQVRLYHDAGTAEVVSYQDHTHFKAVYSDDEMPRFSWDEKNQLNLFLAEWLTLCLEGGLGRLMVPACLRPVPTTLPASCGND